MRTDDRLFTAVTPSFTALENVMVEAIGELPTKKEIEEVIQKYRTRLELGGHDVHPLLEYLTAGRLETLAKAIKEEAKDQALAEARNYDVKELKDLYSSKVQIRTGGFEYDYSHLPEWVEIYEEEQCYLEQAKMAANKRKAIEKNAQMVGAAKIKGEKPDTLAITIL